MTVCAIVPPSTDGADEKAGTVCALTADGAYAARLALDGDCWFPERWTLDGPEPYAVPLPGNQPEEPGTEVQPLADGRVLIHRLIERRHAFSLLYPTGPGTGELPLGAVECPEPGSRLTLLPPAPGGTRAYALAVGPRSSTVWLVAGGAFGPERLAEVPGSCSGGVWLDRAGRMLALDRELGGPVKAVVVDLERAEVSPLLQITADSEDRLLLADPDSGLLLISSDAPSPGQERLGWGVLGSTLPVRFPESLRVPGCVVTPFAIQPGQVLTPESCAVALRVDGPLTSWVGTWRPNGRRMSHLPAPGGWLTGTGWWTQDGVLRLPYTTQETPCGVADLTAPRGEAAGAGGMAAARGETAAAGGTAAGPQETAAASRTATVQGETAAAGRTVVAPEEATAVSCTAAVRGDAGPEGTVRDGTAAGAPEASRQPTEPDPPEPVVARPVPLQQAPLGRLVTN
ncbi:hypothetical protein A6P39_028995 [Streptomyces sp. FXJ1.172]|uniref:hypothetical protein n=1 Tax=Streptomyces sp. FXJ1.172 TaxID=710705 RepID=UPI0007CFBDB1|nr:hypothetical protein [Streptomyces sp. FXJ1.172]WEO97729.1 hypothetical protein A6P39_028995 [Streptomyces sp. FXJ1.172]